MKLLRHLPRLLALLALTGIVCACCVSRARAGGTLTPVGSGLAPVEIRAHQVQVTITAGFARTEVIQTFFNPHPTDLEAIYTFPVPEGASLSEVVVLTSAEEVLRGEVRPVAEARQVYAEEKAAGADAGLATQTSNRNFEFRVAPVRARQEVQLRFVYYQPVAIDTGIGRYVYPLEDGGTDDASRDFWQQNTVVSGEFAVQVDLTSAWPVVDVRAPGFEDGAQVERLSPSHTRLRLAQTGARLTRDFVFYYRLADDLPGRVEVLPYRAATAGAGTFMAIVTPGGDLAPLEEGADTVFVLDVSGSMQAKLATLVDAVGRAVGALRPSDRFRVVTFADTAREVVPWTTARPADVQRALASLRTLQPKGGTNLEAGLRAGLDDLNTARATSFVLVTDGVANLGLTSARALHRLLARHDVRFFGFLLGNNGNWPLVRALADATGGFYTGVSTADDLLGQFLLAKSKVTHAALHDVRLEITGGRTRDLTGTLPRKLFRGQQLVVFGRYDEPGRATLTFETRITGERKTYTTTFDLPAVDAAHPELERLWALSAIDQLQQQEALGLLPAAEVRQAVTQLGVDHQLVTDHTAMVLLTDDAFARRGFERHNLARATTEAAAQAARAAEPARVTRVDAAQPAFGNAPAPHIAKPSSGGGGGGGSFGGDFAALALIALLLGGWWSAQRRLRAPV